MVVSLSIATGDKENQPINADGGALQDEGLAPKSCGALEPNKRDSREKPWRVQPSTAPARKAAQPDPPPPATMKERMMHGFEEQEREAFAQAPGYLGEGEESLEFDIQQMGGLPPPRPSTAGSLAFEDSHECLYQYDMLHIEREDGVDPAVNSPSNPTGDDDGHLSHQDQFTSAPAAVIKALAPVPSGPARMAMGSMLPPSNKYLSVHEAGGSFFPSPAKRRTAERRSSVPSNIFASRPRPTAMNLPQSPPSTAPGGSREKLADLSPSPPPTHSGIDRPVTASGTPVRSALDEACLDTTLSPVTPGLTEKFGGGYFKEGQDGGVDAYLRACSEMRTAPISKLVKAVEEGGGCAHISLAHRGIGDRGCVGLGAFIMENQTVEALDLEDNGIGGEGGSALMAALEKGRVANVSLAGNMLQASMESTARMLAMGGALRVLCLERCKLGDRGAEALAVGLSAEDCGLESLRIGSNGISDVGFAKICGAMEAGSPLVHLDAEWNSIRNAAPLAAALKNSYWIRSISLKWNKIGDAGASVIAKALVPPLRPPPGGLGCNATLEHLDLSYCEVGKGGAACQDIARAVQLSTSLRHIVVSGNQIGDAGGAKVLSGAHKSSKLMRIEMRACGLSRSGPIPVQVVSPEGALEEDNIDILREICPQIMGTLAFPAPPKPAAKKVPQWKVQAEKAGGWNAKVKLDEGKVPASKSTRALADANVAALSGKSAATTAAAKSFGVRKAAGKAVIR